MPIKTVKFRLYPNKETTSKLHWTLDSCREFYNAALSEYKDAYKKHFRQTISQNEQGQLIIAHMQADLKINDITYNQQANDLAELKQEIRQEYEDRAAHVLQDVLRRLDKGMKAFYRRLREGQTPGFPRFKGRDRDDSFPYPDGAGWKREGNTVHLSTIGTVKIKLHRPLEGKIKTVTINKEVDHWYVTFRCDVADAPKLPTSSEDVGIDLGGSHLPTLSHGVMIEHPRSYRKAKKQLELAHQKVSSGKKGSHRRNPVKKQLGKAHPKIANQRRDFLHKESRTLVNQSQVIVFEDIKTSNLVRQPKAKQDEEGKSLPNGAAAKGG